MHWDKKWFQEGNMLLYRVGPSCPWQPMKSLIKFTINLLLICLKFCHLKGKKKPTLKDTQSPALYMFKCTKMLFFQRANHQQVAECFYKFLLFFTLEPHKWSIIYIADSKVCISPYYWQLFMYISLAKRGNCNVKEIPTQRRIQCFP